MGELKIHVGVAVFVLIIVSLILLMWISSWECKNDSDCNSDEICNVKHICYKPQVLEKTVYIAEYKYTPAFLILGICIIIAAVILRTKNLNFLKK